MSTNLDSRFHQREQLLDFLLEIAAAAQETLDLDQLLARIGDIVNEVTPFELLAIMLYSDRRKGLRIRYAIGHRPELVNSLIVPLGEGITGVAAQTRQPVYVPDVRSDGRYLSAVDAVRSEFAVPMIARGKLVGVIDLQSTRLDPYSQEDRDLLNLVASRVAAAIENARLHRRVETNNRSLRMLARLSQEFSTLRPLNEMLGKIAEVVRSLINYDSFTIYLVDAEGRMLRQHFTMRFDERAEVTTIPVGEGITGAAAQTRQVIRVNNTLAEPRYLAVHPDIRSEIAVPLVLHDRVIGVMDLESERVGFFTEDHARILSLLAPTMATSIENARLYQELSERERRMEQDLQAAEQVQRMMLRRDPPHIEGLEIAVGLRPAHTISGDVFHFFQFDNDDALITFGDVSGKGVAAALYGALTTGLMSTMAPRRRSPGKLLEALNDLLVSHKVEARYVSLLALAWNSTNHTLAMANAGALPPYIYREGRVIKPKAEGVPLGLLADNRYEEAHFATQPGDLIVLYSDGITDQENETEDEYGRSGLCNHVRTVWQRSPREIVHSIFEDVDRFAAGMERFDDQTLVVMKVT